MKETVARLLLPWATMAVVYLIARKLTRDK